MEVDVAECERVHADWMLRQADVLGGGSWWSDGLHWAHGQSGLHVLFPDTVTRAGLDAGVDRARALDVHSVRVWGGPELPGRVLRAAGFRRDWSPWWMTATLRDLRWPEPAAVVRFEHGDDLYGPPFEDYGRALALARLDPPAASHAAVRTPDGRFAGRAWVFPDGASAGIFDMDVWPRFQRRGYGTALLGAVCDAAQESGAEHAVLNATPEGKLLYASAGFTQIGVGATWFRTVR